MKKQVLIGLMILTTVSVQAASIAPAKFQALHQRISDATDNLRTILFDPKTGIISHGKQNKSAQAILSANEQAFQDSKAELESALYELLDLIATTEPSKNFPDNWSFDFPDYPNIEQQELMQEEYENLMNGFHGIINKERFVAHFFKLWLTDDYEDEVIGLFYSIGQDWLHAQLLI